MPQHSGRAVQNGAQGEAIKQMPCYPNRSPSPSLWPSNIRRRDPCRSGLIRLQQAHQGIQVRRQQIFAPHVRDHALADLIALAVVLYQAQIFVPAIGGLDRAEEQGLSYYTTTIPQLAHSYKHNLRFVANKCVTTKSQKPRTAPVFSIDYRQRGSKKRKHGLGSRTSQFAQCFGKHSR
jgi:hypothetical protein